MTIIRSSRVVGQHPLDGVLPVLRGAADGVEGAEALGDAGLAVAGANRLAEHLADRERLAAEHRRLVGAADPLEVQVGVEAGRDRVAELLRAARSRSGAPVAAGDEVADPCRLVAIEHDEVVAARASAPPATRWRGSPRASACRG